MKRRQFLKTTAAAGIVTVITPSGILFSCRNNPSTDLDQSFLNPPASAKPFTWWHWMNGNVTKDGITRDLEAMAQVGIGGFQTFAASSGIPTGPAEYLSPLWIDLMKHAAIEAGRLGLEFDMHNCMGWSSSGGSWITPELSMQQVVWSENFVKGGQTVSTKLKQPFKRLDYYKNTIVIAFPSVEGENGSAVEQTKKITLNGKPVNAEDINSFDFLTGIEAISADPSKPSYLLYEFDQAFEARSISINSTGIRRKGKNLGDHIILEASDDGANFKKVAELSKLSDNVELPATAGFPAVKAKYFRLMIPKALKISTVSLSASESLNEWTFKANYPKLGKFNPEIELDVNSADDGLDLGAINPEDVIDITKYMNELGELNWDAPAGHWTILRFGHTTTGATNHPAEGKGLGLECDKYNQEALDFHFNYMLENLLPAIQPLAENGKFGMLIDSYEVDNQNWTTKMPEEFYARKGYSLINYLPVLAGRVVGNVNTSERFLWDFRRTCTELIAVNYQDHFVELCKKNNILSYTEPYNHSPFDQMLAGAKMDINLGEFWLKAGHFSQSIKLASSIQNMNGKQIVAAESFTGRPYYSKWQEFPFNMKAQGDYMLTLGLTRFIFHRYAHQPHPTAIPGMTMGQWGFHFDRTNTWFSQGKQWLDYISRCQYMLQQGVFVGDVMCFTGEEAPGDDISMGALWPDLPDGYDFKYANREIILDKVKIADGKITLPDGLTFSLLLMPNKVHMTIEVARKLKELVAQGMILVGPKPATIPSLTNFTDMLTEFKQIVDEIWGTETDSMVDRKVGQGRVFSGMPVQNVIQTLGIEPDFKFTSKSGDAPINYIHRKTKGGHIYFVANRKRYSEDLVCDFRVSGLEPELWDADSGKVIPLKLYETKSQITSMPLHLAPGGSIFVVFRKSASRESLISLVKNGESLLNASHYHSDRQIDQTIANNFTVSLWVKPETDELLPTELGAFTETTRYTSCYPIYPPPGAKFFGDGHSSFCLLVARNGVAVFEKADENLEAVLIAKMPISSWNHFTVVYHEGTPALYVNGKFLSSGAKSDKIVHAVILESLKNDKLFYYDGDLCRPVIYDKPMSESEVKEIFDEGKPVDDYSVEVEPAMDQKPAWLFWNNGDFKIKASNGTATKVSVSGINDPIELSGPWTVNFPAGLGAPEQIILPELRSLHTHSIDGVKYFSGTASYNKVFRIEASLISDEKRVFLDLGRIAVISEIILNGKVLGILWKPPYRVDITDVVKEGVNELLVKVTNQWPNRLIGDEQQPAENAYKEFGDNGAAIIELPDWYKEGKPKPAGGRVTFSTWQHFSKDSPLLESGLIGPVVIRNAVAKAIDS